MTTSDTDWIQVGAEVAEYRRGFSARADLGTIDRLTATQIVLSNGKRYNRQRLREVANPDGKIFLPADAPEVRNAIAADTMQTLFFQVYQMGRDGKTRTVDTALAALGEIERAVTAARAAITGKEA